MEGYSALRQRVKRFLNENPDVQQITLKRPVQEKRRVWLNSADECYGRMPESCPVVQQILSKHLPTDGTMKIMRDDSTGAPPFEVDIESLRDRMFTEIHALVTSRFRTSLEEVCEQKHVLLAQLRAHQKALKGWIEENETEIPGTPVESEPRTRGRSREDVEFEIDDSDL
jgi:hypothetical protein